MSLFAPPWKTSDPKKIGKAMTFVDGIDDIQKLFTIANEAPLSDVRGAAKSKIILLTEGMDNGQLISIIETVRIDDIHNAIVERMNDEQFLKELVLNRKCLCREMACSKIHDEGFLLQILRKNENSGICLEAAKHIKSKEGITEIAKGNYDPDLLMMTISKIDDLALMDEVITARTPENPRLIKVKELKILAHAYRCRDVLMCRTYDGDKLRYVACGTNDIVSYHEEYPYAEYAMRGFFSAGDKEEYLNRKERNDPLSYPFANVEVTDGNGPCDIRICPACHGVREGETGLLDKCTCGSDAAPVPMGYTPAGNII